MECAASALCVVPTEGGRVLCMCPQLHIMRNRCGSTRLAVNGCLGEQQAKASSGSVGECECYGCVVW